MTFICPKKAGCPHFKHSRFSQCKHYLSLRSKRAFVCLETDKAFDLSKHVPVERLVEAYRWQIQ